MTVPTRGGAHGTDAGRSHTRAARWATVISVVTVAVMAVSYAIFAVVYATEGVEAIEDTWVGFLGGFALLGGLLASLVAFILAVVARVKHERWALLWLPLSLFPALFAGVVLGELFWWE